MYSAEGWREGARVDSIKVRRSYMTPDKHSEMLREQLNALMSLYEHHLDLFWKWISLYATIVAAITAYIFNKDITPATKRLFPIMIAIASLGVAFGCFIMWSWLKELEREVKRISDEINAPAYPRFLGIRMTSAALVTALLFAAFNVLYTIYGNFQ
jgi:disulfide bond formation protein DsbB